MLSEEEILVKQKIIDDLEIVDRYPKKVYKYIILT
jgi:hypothetical protein